MKNKIKKISFIITIILVILFLFIILYSPIFDVFISDTAEYTFNCNPTATPDINCEEGCECKDPGSFWCHRQTYLLPKSMVVSSIWGELIIHNWYETEPVKISFLINSNWVEKITWDVYGSLSNEWQSFYFIFAPVEIEGFRFETGIFQGSNMPYIYYSRGTILVEVEEVEQCVLRVYVEDFVGGSAIKNKNVNVQSYPSGVINQNEYTNNEGIASFILDYGAYTVTVDSNSRMVNLDKPTKLEIFTLYGSLDGFPLWIIILIFLIIIIAVALIYYFYKRKKEKKGRKKRR